MSNSFEIPPVAIGLIRKLAAALEEVCEGNVAGPFDFRYYCRNYCRLNQWEQALLDQYWGPTSHISTKARHIMEVQESFPKGVAHLQRDPLYQNARDALERGEISPGFPVRGVVREEDA